MGECVASRRRAETSQTGMISAHARARPLSYAEMLMTLVPLTTYLRMYRKRTGFTHEELAFLCGAMCGSSIARHEKGARLLKLRTALMYECILQASVRELYAGLFHEALESVKTRATGLRASLERRPPSSGRDHKIAMLQELLTQIGEVTSSPA